MDFERVVRRRRMVRRFSPAPIPQDMIRELLELAVHAPSAGFSQGWAFVVLEGAETGRFWAATDDGRPPDSWRRGLMTAPVLVLALSSKRIYLERYAEPDKGWTDRDEARWPVPYWHIDTGMAALLLLLGAVDRGLGACFFGIPPEQLGSVRAAFDLPDDHDPIGVVALGTPAPDRPSPSLRRGRRPLEEIVHWGRW
jgi:nitroreductase